MAGGIYKRGLALVVLLPALLAGFVPAARADGSGHFLDDQPVVIDVSVERRYTVQVVNSGDPEQTYTLTIVGNAAEHLVVRQSTTTVSEGTGQFVLMVGRDPRPASGTLVLTGTDGTLDRLAVRLVGFAASAGDAVIPGTSEELTVPAVSSVPSVVRPVPTSKGWWVGFVVSVVVVLLLSLLYRNVRQKGRAVSAAIASGILAVLVAVVWFGAVAGTQLADRLADDPVPSIERTLFPPTTGIVVGTLAGDTGSEGRMTASNGTLVLSEIDRAGSYTGSLDSQPTESGGEIKASVAVRDHWGYAAAVVALGVLIGYLISFFYANRRVTGQTQLEIAKARREVAERESKWELRTVGQPWNEAYRIHDFVTQALDTAEKTAESDQAAADAEVSAADDFVKAADSLRERVNSEAALTEQVGDSLARLFQQGLDTPNWFDPLDEPLPLRGQSVAAALDIVKARTASVEVAGRTRQRAARALLALMDLGERIEKRSKEGCDTAELLSRWTQLGPSLVQASDEDAVKEVEKNISEMGAALQELQAPPSELPTAQPYAGGGLTQDQAALAAALQTTPAVEAQVLAAAETRLTPPEGDRDDLFEVDVDITVSRAGQRVQWVFSDGSSSSAFAVGTAAGERVSRRIHHVFSDGPSTLRAELVSIEDGHVLASWTGRVADPGRAARLSHSLASDDRLVGLVAFVLAVGSGMVALYVPNSTWGTAGDYLTALLWGAVTAEGIRAAVNIIGKRWPVPVGGT